MYSLEILFVALVYMYMCYRHRLAIST